MCTQKGRSTCIVSHSTIKRNYCPAQNKHSLLFRDTEGTAIVLLCLVAGHFPCCLLSHASTNSREQPHGRCEATPFLINSACSLRRPLMQRPVWPMHDFHSSTEFRKQQPSCNAEWAWHASFHTKVLKNGPMSRFNPNVPAHELLALNCQVSLRAEEQDCVRSISRNKDTALQSFRENTLCPSVEIKCPFCTRKLVLPRGLFVNSLRGCSVLL